MKHILSILKENRKILRFCSLLIILLVFFKYLEFHYFEQLGLHQSLVNLLGNTSISILQLFGFDLNYSDSMFLEGVILEGENPILGIGAPCNGLSFMTLFISFVLAFPSQRPINKIWFILLGIALIHVLNTIRVILLILNFQYSSSTFDFNHKYTFIIVVYGIVLWMWVVWAKRNANTN